MFRKGPGCISTRKYGLTHTRPNRRAGYTVRELTAARLHGSRRATLTRFSRLKYLRSLKPATRRQRVVRQAGSACRWIRFLGTLCICRLPAQLPGTLEGTRPFTQPATCPSYTTRPKFSALSLLVHILQPSWTIRTCMVTAHTWLYGHLAIYSGHCHDLLESMLSRPPSLTRLKQATALSGGDRTLCAYGSPQVCDCVSTHIVHILHTVIATMIMIMAMMAFANCKVD